MRQLVIVFILALILTGGASFLIGRTSVGSIIQTEIVEIPVEIPGPEIIREVPGPERVVRRDIIIEVPVADEIEAEDERFQEMNAFFSMSYAFGTPRRVIGTRPNVTDAILPPIVTTSITEATEAAKVWGEKCHYPIPTNIEAFFDPGRPFPNCARAPSVISWISLEEAISLQEVLRLEVGDTFDGFLHPYTRIMMVIEGEILYNETAYFAQIITWWKLTGASLILEEADENEGPFPVEVIPDSLIDVQPIISEMLEVGELSVTRNISTPEYVSLFTAMNRYLDWPPSAWLPILAEGFVQNKDESTFGVNGFVAFFIHNDVKYSLEFIPNWEPIFLDSLGGPPPPAQEESQNLKEQVMRFHSAIEDFDVDQVMTFYVNPGTRVDWKGQAGVLEGTYPEWSNVRLLWRALMGNLQDIQITMSHYQASIVGDEALVTYIIINRGRGTLIGDYRMVVSVNTTWSLVDGNWIIEEDSWGDFILWEAEIVAITY